MSEQNQQIYGFDNFRLDVANRRLLRDGAPVSLQAKAFDVLVVLIENGGRLIGKDELFSRVWPDLIVEESNLTVQVSAIRRALGDNKDNPHYIITVPGHGYRFTSNVLLLNESEEEEELVIEHHSHSRIVVETERGAAQESSVALTNPKSTSDAMVSAGSARASTSVAGQNGDLIGRSTSSAEYLVGEIKRHRRGGAIAVGFLMIAIGATAYFYYSARGHKTEINSIAILPFTNVGADPDTEYLSDGLTESLINNLSRLSNLRVTARTTAFTFKGRSVNPRQAGRELGVDALLTGRVTQRADTLSIQVDLISVADGSQLWGEHYQRKLSDILALQGEITREISAKMRLKLTGAEERRLSERYTENVEAYQLYLQGRYQWYKQTEDGLKKAIEYFEQAVDKDPNYALAHAGLADSYWALADASLSVLEALPKAKDEANRALQLDDSLAEAHTSLAVIKLNFEFDWTGAENEFKRAIDLNPNYAEAHHQYGWLLTQSGRPAEGLEEMKRAQRLDPLNLVINVDINAPLYQQRRFDLSVEQSRKVVAMDPSFFLAHYTLGFALLQLRDFSIAIAELEKARSLEDKPWVVGTLAYGYALSGNRTAALKLIHELHEQAKHRHVTPFWFAVTSIALGDKDDAFKWLEQCYAERSFWLTFLKMDPILDPLRDDPRFKDLLKRLRFPE